MALPSTPFVLWFTGLPSAGKTTLAEGLLPLLAEQGIPVEHLDGDIVRTITANQKFDSASRDQHIRQMGFLASRLEYHGVSVLASFVSPIRESRDFVRNLCKNFIEVHVATPLAVCEERDVKGLYRKARAGELSGLTGVDSTYEPPERPELVVETDKLSLDENLHTILAYVQNQERR